MFKDSNFKTKLKRFLCITFLFILILPAFSMPVFAETDVAGAVTNAVNAYMKPQIVKICDNVVFPLIECGLGIGLIFSIARAVRGYRGNGGELEWQTPAILLCCLIFVLTSPLWIWSAIGWGSAT